MCRTCGCSDDAQPTLTDLQTGVKLPLSTDRQHHEHHHHELGHVHSHEHHHDHDHDHNGDHDHHHAHEPESGALHAHHHGHVIHLEHELLAKNRLLAERNRGWLAGRDILALNLISSPGAGKTTLLERTIRDLADEVSISVIEG